MIKFGIPTEVLSNLVLSHVVSTNATCVYCKKNLTPCVMFSYGNFLLQKKGFFLLRRNPQKTVAFCPVSDVRIKLQESIVRPML